MKGALLESGIDLKNMWSGWESSNVNYCVWMSNLLTSFLMLFAALTPTFMECMHTDLIKDNLVRLEVCHVQRLCVLVQKRERRRVSEMKVGHVKLLSSCQILWLHPPRSVTVGNHGNTCWKHANWLKWLWQLTLLWARAPPIHRCLPYQPPTPPPYSYTHTSTQLRGSLGKGKERGMNRKGRKLYWLKRDERKKKREREQRKKGRQRKVLV